MATKIAGKYRVDHSKMSVSGFSSGGAMATHMHVAYSSVFMGVGVIAGCKQHSYFCYLKSFLFSGIVTGAGALASKPYPTGSWESSRSDENIFGGRCRVARAVGPKVMVNNYIQLCTKL